MNIAIPLFDRVTALDAIGPYDVLSRLPDARITFVGHAPGVVRTLLYRKDFFGRPFSELTQQVMRGPSPWTVGEREIFAAFVSRLNQCVF
jgi:putative intracellular protease/amidase